MKLAGALVGFLLLGAGILAVAPTAQAATSRTLAITQSSANPIVPFQAFDGNPPKVFDVNGDGRLEIVAQNDNQWVYIFDSKTGAILSQLKTVFPPGWGARSFNGPEVAVLNGDGKVRLVIANSAATITVYRFDPVASSTTKLAFVKEWERRMSDCHPDPGMDAKPVLADLDLDGRLEILVQTEELGVYALRDDGRLMWKKCIGGGNGDPVVSDLNQDGWPDVVFASDGAVVTAVGGRTGATMWSFNVLSRFNLGSGSMPVGAGIGQLDGKLGPDVVVGARDSHDATDWSQDHAALVAIDSTGRMLWGRQDPTGNPLTYTHPVIVDADKNGVNEVYWADWNTNGHKPPANEADAWKVLGPANFYRYDAAGNLVWKQTMGTWWNNKDLSLGDVDGDGIQEVVANGPGPTGHDGIWYLDSRNGAKETFIDLYPFKAQREPILADLWSTGTMQWVVEVGGQGPGGGPGILVYDTHVAYNAVWPHLPYPPRPGSQPPPPPPPPPSGTFSSTFTIRNPNAWWQEVTIQPSTPHTIAKMEVRLDGEFWRPMTKSSWGPWTSSYNTPAGTPVEFLATDTAGAVSQSAVFTWLDGSLTKGSVTPGTAPPPPPPEGFTATFAPTSNSNEWWVEVKVTANEPVVKVEAKGGTGNWVLLSATDWGTWAKSFFVAKGTSVQFRATSSSGAVATSGSFQWLGAADPGPDPGTFTATFQPLTQGNDWWTEVKVTGSRPVVKVEARVNSGSWIDLPKTDWGTWAKSFYIANGSQVTFRATSDNGLTATSASYLWG